MIVGLGKITRQAGGDGPDLGLGLAEGDAWLETGDHRIPGPVPNVSVDVGEIKIPQVNPAIPKQRIVEDRRHDTDHGHRPAVKPQGPAQHVGIARQVPLPIRVGQDHDRRLFGFILRSEGAPLGGREAEDAEKVRGDCQGNGLFRGVTGHRQAVEVAEITGGKVGENRVLFAKVAEIAGSKRAGWPLGGHAPDLHHSVGFRIRLSQKEQPMQDSECRGVDADSERQGEERDEGEAGRLHQLPEGDSHENSVSSDQAAGRLKI